MHLYLMTRGVKHAVDKWITELQGKYLPFKWREKDGEPLKDMSIQLGVRPIQLWEIVFPEESKDIVLATCLDGNSGETQHKKHQKYIWALRKMLGVEPIPEYDNKGRMPADGAGVEKIGIGIKKDYWITKDGKRVENKEDGAFEGI